MDAKMFKTCKWIELKDGGYLQFETVNTTINGTVAERLKVTRIDSSGNEVKGQLVPEGCLYVFEEDPR